MPLKDRLFDHMILRNIAGSFGFRSQTDTKNFIPYFQYKIDKYKGDYYLHFPKQPWVEQYKNEIFNKLCEYDGYNIIKFVEFHFEAFPDKKEFLRFLKYEINERLLRYRKNANNPKLQTMLDWVTEKSEELIKEEEVSRTKKEIEYEIRSAVKSNQINGAIDTAGLINEIVDKVSGLIRGGQITLNNKNHEEKLLDVFIILSEIQFPIKGPKAERVFKDFSQADLALLLQVHFAPFKDHRHNTIQKKLAERSKVCRNNLKTEKLAETLADHFFKA